MATILFYLIALSFTLASVMYAKHQFEDEQSGWARSRGRWHGWGAFQRSVPFMIALFPAVAWYDVFLAGAVCIPLFEIGINVIALHMPIFYDGRTSKMDKLFNRIQWYVMGGLLVAALVIKVTPLKYSVARVFMAVVHWIYLPAN